MNPRDAKVILEDARPIPYRDPYERDEKAPESGCGCGKGAMKPGCVRHDPQERRAA